MLNHNLLKENTTENVTVDEQPLPYRDRNRFTHISAKPSKYGIGIWWYVMQKTIILSMNVQLCSGKIGPDYEINRCESVPNDLALHSRFLEGTSTWTIF